MSTSIDFYFDFSSPYGYFSSLSVDDLQDRCNCEVIWRPYLMGAVMKITERKPLVSIPIINDYSTRDLNRIARRLKVAYKTPSKFPIATVAACRAFYWLTTQDSNVAKKLAKDLLRAYFEKDKLISDPAIVIQIANENGIDTKELSNALEDEQIKLKLRQVNDEAIKRGVFGSPFFIIGNEPFWGHDRLESVEAWIKTGGW